MCLKWLFVTAIFAASSLSTSSKSLHNPPNLILQLFQWPWEAVARLCPVLGKNGGFGAVQVSPAQPHRIINTPPGNREVRRPWWERYQPTAFRIGETRGGTPEEFINMVKECNASGIDVYVEVVLNHLIATDAEIGRDIECNWFEVTETKNITVWLDSKPKHFGPQSTEPCIGKLPIPKKSNSTDDSPKPGDFHNCLPTLPYTSNSKAPLLKIDLTDPAVKMQVQAYLRQLVNAGVKGCCIIAAAFSSLEDLGAVFNETESLFVYLELLSLEQPTVDGYNTTDMSRFSLASAATISDFVLEGLDAEHTTDGLYTVFSQLQTLSKPWYPLSINAFEHHEQIYGENSSELNVDYSAIKRLSEELRTIATVFLLLTPKYAGIPRLVSGYRQENGKNWQGPPMQPPVIPALISEDISAWQNEYNSPWLKKLLELRNKRFVGDRDSSEFFSTGQIYIPIPSLPVREDIKLDGVMLFVFGELQRDPGGKSCPMIIALISSHYKTDNGVPTNNGIQPGIYKAKYANSIEFSETIINVNETDQISDSTASYKVELSVTQEELDYGSVYELTVNVSWLETFRPKFLILDVVASGTIPCGSSKDPLF